MHVAELVQRRQPNDLWTNTGLKDGRGLFFRWPENDMLYVRDDGTSEPFTWPAGNHKDDDWSKLGTVDRANEVESIKQLFTRGEP